MNQNGLSVNQNWLSLANPKRSLSVAMLTSGCRLNQFESDGIIGRLLETGKFRKPTAYEKPDVVIVNTCTVTDKADKKNLKVIRDIKKENPQAKVIVTGCFAETDPEQSEPLADLVIGNQNKSNIPVILSQWVDQTLSGNDVSEVNVASDRFAYGFALPDGHTRAYLKIQDGCDRKCSYCKIPRARGAGVSRNFFDIIDHVKKLQDMAVPEIVLTGVNLGWYRDNGLKFNPLLEKILSVLKTTRLRISSIEPCDVNRELAEISLHPLFCDFLHVPLQSGSAKILRSMKRTYRPDSFRKRMETVFSVNPDIMFGTDVIAGFPGETEQDFMDSIELLRDLNVARIHAFPFSKRTGTRAADITEGIVPKDTIRDRINFLKEMSSESYLKYAKRFVGKERTIVVEKSSTTELEKGMFRGITDNFLHVKGYGNLAPGSLITVQLQSVTDSIFVNYPVR